MSVESSDPNQSQNPNESKRFNKDPNQRIFYPWTDRPGDDPNYSPPAPEIPPTEYVEEEQGTGVARRVDTVSSIRTSARRTVVSAEAARSILNRGTNN